MSWRKEPVEAQANSEMAPLSSRTDHSEKQVDDPLVDAQVTESASLRGATSNKPPQFVTDIIFQYERAWREEIGRRTRVCCFPSFRIELHTSQGAMRLMAS